MSEAPNRQDHNLVSREGVIAGVLCAVIPLTITGILLFRYLTQRGSFDVLLLSTVPILFAIVIMHIFISVETNKIHKQLLADDFTPPSNKFKLLYGAGHGMMVSLIGMILMLLGLYFSV